MKIYSMTATFGKLEHETLTLQPGLNVIHAPNEWGKSTWCAFLVAMLYGFEARSRTTQTALSDKEHFTPWSGSPMAGRMELNWNGRDITIERRTKGRSIFGEFQAYETASGIAVPELTAANCGQMLLGVEKSVFTRSAFVRLTDMPVTQDEALRHRLNTLVTTGDESGAAENLERKLRDLRNRCRYNRSGLLPQAEAEAAELKQKIQDLHDLDTQIQQLKQRQTSAEFRLAQLENHRDALAYDRSREAAAQVDLARQAAQTAAQKLRDRENACAGCISREQAAEDLVALDKLEAQISEAQVELRLLEAPEVPVHPIFGSEKPDVLLAQVTQDIIAYRRTRRTRNTLLISGLAAILTGVAAWFLVPDYPMASWILGGMGVVVALLSLIFSSKKLEQHYGSKDPSGWHHEAEAYLKVYGMYEHALEDYSRNLMTLEADLEKALAQQAALCGEKTPQEQVAHLQSVIARWEDLEDAQREAQFHEEKVLAMTALVREVAPPKFPDQLELPEKETLRQITDTTVELHQLQRRLGQCQGQMEAIGLRSQLEADLHAVQNRLGKLEETYAALSLALTTLETARDALQRRFAPKIAGRAQELLGRLTDGRYDRLVLTQDLSLQATAREEATLRTVLWRSDGTIDQLYLALRLAVAEELIPDAPLVLDDALVRFDDTRLKAAMEVLGEEAASRQVIVFTCQKREQEML